MWRWNILPGWVKALTLFVGLPAWLGFAGMIVTGATFDHENLALTLFALFSGVAACHTFFIARAFWRNEV